jgi:deoxyribose-phosphate aldolase
VPAIDPPRDDDALAALLDDLRPLDLDAVDRRVDDARSADAAGPGDLDAIVGLIDLTTLEDGDTPESVRALCARAVAPVPVAGVCVYPRLVSVVAEELTGTGLEVAGVAGAFPSGIASVAEKVAEAQAVVDAGGTEVDLVINREAFLAGHHAAVLEEVSAVRHAVPGRRLKVILETGSFPDLPTVRRAAWLVLLGGADMLKTSTGKIGPGADPPAAAVLLDTARQYATAHGRTVGVKVSGGIRTVDDALVYLRLARATFGANLTPRQFRFGASALHSAVVAALGAEG